MPWIPTTCPNSPSRPTLDPVNRAVSSTEAQPVSGFSKTYAAPSLLKAPSTNGAPATTTPLWIATDQPSRSEVLNLEAISRLSRSRSPNRPSTSRRRRPTPRPVQRPRGVGERRTCHDRVTIDVDGKTQAITDHATGRRELRGFRRGDPSSRRLDEEVRRACASRGSHYDDVAVDRHRASETVICRAVGSREFGHLGSIAPTGAGVLVDVGSSLIVVATYRGPSLEPTTMVSPSIATA